VDWSVYRMVEKDNKRLRDEVRKEYNNAVRELAIFIQNRDPRYHAYQRQRERSKKEAARSTAGMGPRGSGKSTPTNARAKPTATQSVHARMAHQREVDSFTLQSWQKAENNIDWDEDDFATSAKPKKPKNWNETGMVDEDESEESEGEGQYECFACNKLFASEKTWENHERSKKHKQAVWR
jgi:DnaJ family protein A protein 5